MNKPILSEVLEQAHEINLFFSPTGKAQNELNIIKLAEAFFCFADSGRPA